MRSSVVPENKVGFSAQGYHADTKLVDPGMSIRIRNDKRPSVSKASFQRAPVHGGLWEDGEKKRTGDTCSLERAKGKGTPGLSMYPVIRNELW